MKYSKVSVLHGVLVWGALVTTQSHAQAARSTFVDIGQFAGLLDFPKLVNYPQLRTTSAAFAGKLLLVTTWGTYCSTCIADMPQLLALQKQFNNRVQVFLVSPESTADVEKFYQKRPRLRVPTVASDTAYLNLAKRFGIPSLGITLWIDGLGILRGVTLHDQVTAENIKKILNGESVRLVSAQRADESKQAPEVVQRERKRWMSFDDNQEDTSWVEFQSVLTRAIPDKITTGYAPAVGNGFRGRRITLRNASPSLFVATAYAQVKDNEIFDFGKTVIPLRIRLEGVDSTWYWGGLDWANRYCYRLVVPPGQERTLLQTMRSDIRRYFGLVATWEVRRTNVWVLRQRPAGMRRSTGGGETFEETPIDLQMHNQPVSKLAQWLETVGKRFVVDETSAANAHIDVTIGSLFKADAVTVNRALASYGFRVDEEERDIPLLIVRKRVVSSGTDAGRGRARDIGRKGGAGAACRVSGCATNRPTRLIA